MTRVLPRLWNEDTGTREKSGIRLAAYGLLAVLVIAVGARLVVHFA